MMRKDSNPAAYDAPTRRSLLDAYFAALERMRAEEQASAASPEALAEVGALWDRYVAGTPRPVLSRCPFSQVLVHHSIDPYGLDGLWWSFDGSARPIEELPPTFFALAGALKLGAPREDIPFLCKPGPEVPFVVPRVLRHPAVRAVITSLPVGAHTGFPIFYFANPTPWDLERVDTWGTGLYRFETLEGRPAWHASDWEPEDFDFDLARWMRAGKLFWIDPADPDASLRGSPEGCPFLEVQGRRMPMNLQGTQVWDGVLFSEEELEHALVATAGIHVQGAPVPGEEVPGQGESAVTPEGKSPPVVGDARDEVPAPTQEAPPQPAQPLPPAETGPKFCRACGSPLRPGAKFCSNCGTPVRRA